MQLSNVAFTVSGLAYELDDVLINRPSPMVVTALSPSSTDWVDRLREVGHDNFPKTSYPVDELHGPRCGQASYIVIGVVPSVLPEDWRRFIKSGSQSHVVGIDIPPGTKTFKPDRSLLPLRVAAPIISEDPKGGLTLYALTDIDPESRLCHAHVINQDNIFYFSDYRTNARTLGNRKREWNRKVLDASVRGSGKSTPLARNITTARAPTLAEPGPMNELALWISRWPENLDEETWERIRGLLLELPVNMPSVSSQLETFLDGSRGQRLDLEEAKELSSELSKIWPELEYLSPKCLQLTREGLLEEKITVSNGHARYFLIVCWIAGTANEAYLVKHIQSLATWARLLHQDGRSELHELPAALQPGSNKVIALLEALTANFRDLRKRHKDVADQLFSARGDRTVALSPEALYARLVNTVSQDEFRLLFDQAVLSHVLQFEVVLHDTADDIEAMATLLENAIKALTTSNS